MNFTANKTSQFVKKNINMMPIHAIYNTTNSNKKLLAFWGSGFSLDNFLSSFALTSATVRRYKTLWVPECSVLGRSLFKVLDQMSH